MVSPNALRRSPRRHSPQAPSPTESPKQRPNARARLADCQPAPAVERRLALTPVDENIEMLDLAPDKNSKAFTFLSRLNRVALRNIGRKWSRRGTGNKKEYLYRNMLYLMDGSRAGREIETMLIENDACPSFADFLKQAEEVSLDFQQCPSEEDIRNHLRSAGDPEERPTRTASGASGDECVDSETRNTPSFSLSEFARLYVMLRDDHVCKQALLRLTQDLKRADFEAGRTRQSFWKEIEKRFNDESLQYLQSFEGSVPEADSAAPPLCHRPFEVLKAQLQQARKAFTLVYSNYTQSGQNNPDKWTDFLGRDKQGEFLAASKRCYIIFVACNLDQRCGQDMFLLNATKKTFEGGDDEGPEGESSRSSGKRKRMSSDAFNAAMNERWSDLRGFMEDTKKQGEAIRQSVTTKEDSIAKSFSDVAERNDVLQMVTSAYKTYADAEKIGADPTLVGFLKSNYERALKKYAELEESSQS